MRRLARFSVPFLALFVVGGTAGMAQADSSDDDSVVGVHDNNVSFLACHNDVPINVLGIQVPVYDIAASLGIPIASEDSPSEGPDQSCNQSSAGGKNEGSAGHSSSGDDRDDGATADKSDHARNPDNDKDNDDRDGGLPGPLLAR